MEEGNSEDSSLMDKANENATSLDEETSSQSTECKLTMFSAFANKFL